MSSPSSPRSRYKSRTSIQASRKELTQTQQSNSPSPPGTSSNKLTQTPDANPTQTSIISSKHKIQDSPPPNISQSNHLNIPPELQRLNDLDKIIIKEKVNWGETAACCLLTHLLSFFNLEGKYEGENEYELLLPDGKELLFVANENSESSFRQFVTKNRPFDMQVKSKSGEVMFVATSPFKFCVASCGPCSWFGKNTPNCCRDEISVYGTLPGQAVKNAKTTTTTYNVMYVYIVS